MFDIEFYMKIHQLKKRILGGEKYSRAFLEEKFESYRSPVPVVYNIETTNACNMRCEMCPRTTMMTRPIETMKPELFKKVIDQLSPFTEDQLNRWNDFVDENYGIDRHGMSENHFFLYIIPRVIALHGYGDPLLDRNMPKYVGWMTDKGLESYFSCNPANINIEHSIEIFMNGLDYVKYSIESVDDQRHKQIRGEASNFSIAYRDILKLLEVKAKRNFKTTIVITMLNLNKPGQLDEYERLKEAFKGCDVYIYLKSQNGQWFKSSNQQNQSFHWQEFCQAPWSSMTVKSNGECAHCFEDFNNEMIMGDAHDETLFEIWNNQKYAAFRKTHFDLTPGIKCTEQCDMQLIGSFLAI